MKRRRLILGLIALPIALVTAVVMQNVYRIYIAPDSLEEVERDTRRMLRNYERTQDPSELRGMFSYPPEAGGAMTAMPIVAEWAIEHQEDFIVIIDGLHQGEDREVFVRAFTVISQSSLDKEFAAAFRKQYHSPVLDQIKENLPPAYMWNPTQPSNADSGHGKEPH